MKGRASLQLASWNRLTWTMGPSRKYRMCPNRGLYFFPGSFDAILWNMLAPTKPVKMSFAELSEVRHNVSIWNPKRWWLLKEFALTTIRQAPRESEANYVAELRKLTLHCQLRAYLTVALRGTLGVWVDEWNTIKAHSSWTWFKYEASVAQSIEAADSGSHRGGDAITRGAICHICDRICKEGPLRVM